MLALCSLNEPQAGQYIGVVLGIAHVESFHCLPSRGQCRDSSLLQTRQHEATRSGGSVIEKSNTARIREPAPPADRGTLRRLAADRPPRRGRRCIAPAVQESPQVGAAIDTQLSLDPVHVQSPAFSVGGEVFPV